MTFSLWFVYGHVWTVTQKYSPSFQGRDDLGRDEIDINLLYPGGLYMEYGYLNGKWQRELDHTTLYSGYSHL